MEPQASAKVSAQDLKLLKDRGDHSHDISAAFSCNTMLEFIRFGIKRSFTGSAGSIIKAARWTADHPRVVLRRLGTVSISIVCMCVVLFIVVHIHVNIHALRRSIVTQDGTSMSADPPSSDDESIQPGMVGTQRDTPFAICI